MNNVTPWVIEAKGISKTYLEGPSAVTVLSNVDLSVAAGDSIAIIGASGSGKSTLLHLLGGLDHSSSGSVHIMGQALVNLSEAAKGRLRNQYLGFIYQFHHLLPEFSALENVAMPLLIRRQSRPDAQQAASEILSKVGLAHRLHHKPSELSGGERQRAAIARALVTRPACVLADEPTGNLDRGNAETVFAEMLELNADLGTSLIIVTHDPQLAARAQRRLQLQDGVLHPV